MEAPEGQFSSSELEEVQQNFASFLETRTPSLIRVIILINSDISDFKFS
jgi:hypothetical protein